MAKKNFKELFDPTEHKWGGFNLPTFLCLLIVVAIVVYVPFGLDKEGNPGSFLRPNFLIMFSALAVFGLLFGEIGDRIPIWDEFIGGGTILVFVLAAVFGTYKLVPENFMKAVNIFYNKQPVNFLEMFIPALIVGSVLTVDRKTLIKSISGYIPLIIIGVVGASIGGIVVGFIFGKTPIDVMMNYVLPIMGGGTGAGAIPMSEIWSSKTGRPASEWFAFAISILSIANIIAILSGALLKKLGEVKQNLTGNGELIIDNSKEAIKDKEVELKPELIDTVAAFILTGVLFMVAHILGELWAAFAKSHHIDFELHRLVFLILLTMFLNIANLVPDKIKAGAKRMQTLFSKHTIWILMAAVGFTTDVQEIINAVTISNLLIALAIVLGAVGFIMLIARKMKFYPIEAAITAGLCMANRGGAGDVAVLGAADRMDLMSFAQISSRIGGAMMLVLGSVLFGLFAK
ncbi:citrate-sodium symporter [Fusobacterium nucleatum YWH7199]|uniref:Putative citrate-sodium symporter n=1 Tax=Fusobacterium nucleatum TaxID=851 RepID=A0A133NVV5_FUSNU|nr:2-hydroxycarboxylate transporter family protein [Fusobacterium nucleatum]KXA20427.1 putative citrate-sodium symporter [Fusobacterium nucleatum]MCL4575528.1 citrate-sodium symporter [Fusobacterium nucleatum YWH7056]MCL4580234.1 citrate-sodium symporter [Fusobacterium nucleatum YWH7199]MCL4583110.1 citrate-sodium symporter [Fusobacterium nucleatum YWH7054]MCL4592639.1 citrate-sodium symporter [Fusobacterium nucleatum YWH7053]